MYPLRFLAIALVSGCNLTGIWLGTCDDVHLVLDLERGGREDRTSWLGTLDIDGESYEAFGGVNEAGDSVVVAPGTDSAEAALMLRGQIGPAGFNGECGATAFTREQ